MNTIRYCGCPKCDVVFKLPAELASGLADENHSQSVETVRCGVCHAVFDVDLNLMQKTDDGFAASGLNHGLHTEVISQSLHLDRDDHDNGSPTEHVDSAQGNRQSAENTMPEICYEIENPFAEHVPYSLNIHEESEPTAVDEDNNEDEEEELFFSLVSPPVEPILDSIPEPTPSEVAEQTVAQHINDRANPLMTFIWFIVAVAFIGLLGAQVKTFFVPQYAQDATYRDYIVYFCYFAGCELPPRQDPVQFALIHTRIDLHPTEPGALQVTVKAVNQAEFSQSYPHLQLTLTDRVGRVVGRRTYSPDLYLPTGTDNMIKQGQLAPIILNLARPHEKAVGFIVEIVSQPARS